MTYIGVGGIIKGHPNPFYQMSNNQVTMKSTFHLFKAVYRTFTDRQEKQDILHCTVLEN